MKKFFIALTIIMVVLIVFWCIEYSLKSNVCEIEKKDLAMPMVTSSKFTCEVLSGSHFNSWTYDYELEDRALYLKVFRLSPLNPMVTQGFLGVDIDYGYNDFDKIYIDNGEGKEKILVWTRDNIFTFDKLSNLNVQSNKLSCALDYDLWDYKYSLVNRKLSIIVFEKDDKNVQNKGGLEVSIDKGYDDFDKVYIKGLGNMELMWSKGNE